MLCPSAIALIITRLKTIATTDEILLILFSFLFILVSKFNFFKEFHLFMAEENESEQWLENTSKS